MITRRALFGTLFLPFVKTPTPQPEEAIHTKAKRLLLERAEGWQIETSTMREYVREYVRVVQSMPEKEAVQYLSECIRQRLACEDEACVGHITAIEQGDL